MIFFAFVLKLFLGLNFFFLVNILFLADSYEFKIVIKVLF